MWKCQLSYTDVAFVFEKSECSPCPGENSRLLRFLGFYQPFSLGYSESFQGPKVIDPLIDFKYFILILDPEVLALISILQLLTHSTLTLSYLCSLCKSVIFHFQHLLGGARAHQVL